MSALLVLSGGVGGYFAYRESTSALESLQRTKAEVVAHEIATFIGRLADDLQSVATKFNTSGGADEEDLRAELVTLLRHQPSITELHWIARRRPREVRALARAPDATESGRDWSKDVRFAATRDSPRYIGPVYFRRETEPYLSLAVSRTGGPVIVAEVNLKFVWDVISQIRVGAAGIAYVVDRRGQLVSHSDISLVLRKPDVSTLPQVRSALARDDPVASLGDDARSIDGMPVFAVAVPIEHLGWTVFVEQSRDEALRPVYASIARSVVLVLLGVIASVTASLLFARSMVRPIRQLEARAREIGEGKLDQRIELDDRRRARSARCPVQSHGRTAAGDSCDAGDPYRGAHARSRARERGEDALSRGGEPRSPAADPCARAIRWATASRRRISAGAGAAGKNRAFGRGAGGSAGGPARSFQAGRGRRHPAAEAIRAPAVSLPTRRGLRAGGRGQGARADAGADKAMGVLGPVVARAHPAQPGRQRDSLYGKWPHPVGCRRHGEEVDLVVVDTGVGIDPEHLPHVFEEFYQAGPLQGG